MGSEQIKALFDKIQKKGICVYVMNRYILYKYKPRRGLVVRAFASQAVGRGFEPRPGHTKDFKNGSSCSSLNAQHKEVELRQCPAD